MIRRRRAINQVVGALVLAVSLAGCVSLTPAAERVRIVRADDDVRGCALIGPLTSTSSWGGVTMGLGVANNARTMRRDVAALGGDTLLIVEEEWNWWYPRSLAKAYRCAPR